MAKRTTFWTSVCVRSHWYLMRVSYDTMKFQASEVEICVSNELISKFSLSPAKRIKQEKDAYLHSPHDSLSSHTLHTLHILCILQICIENIKIRQFVEPCSVVDIILDYWVKGSWIESSCFQHDFITCVLGIKI